MPHSSKRRHPPDCGEGTDSLVSQSSVDLSASGESVVVGVGSNTKALLFNQPGETFFPVENTSVKVETKATGSAFNLYTCKAVLDNPQHLL